MVHNSHPRLMIVAGEVSGDAHGAALVKELKTRYEQIEFFGVGGRYMGREGVELVHHIQDLAVLGVVEVIRHYPRIRSIFFELVNLARQRKPDAVILIDYPGFNIRLAKQLKKYNIPVIYYISPQIWAWGQHRRKIIAERVDKMLVFFDFEKKFYDDTNLDVDFVGHPLIDKLKDRCSRTDFFEKNNFDPVCPLIGLLPGSRDNEIKRLLPIMLRAASVIQQRAPETQFVLPVGPAVPKEMVYSILNKMEKSYQFTVTVIDKQVADTMAHVDLALIASGTATLETACFATPMIIIYKVSFITALLARLVIKIPHIGLVNVVAGRQIVPELLQYDAKPKKIAGCALYYITQPDNLVRKRNELKEIREKLGKPGAVKRAAESISSFLEFTK